MNEKTEVKKPVKILKKIEPTVEGKAPAVQVPVEAAKSVSASVKPTEAQAKAGLGKDVTVPEKTDNRSQASQRGQRGQGGFGVQHGQGGQGGQAGRSGYVRQRFRGRGRGDRDRRENDAYEHSVILLRRTTKVMEGGKRMRFSAMVAIGDKKGKVGLGLGKAADPRSAIEKARRDAKKNLVRVHMINGTVPHEMEHSYKGAKIFIRPAREGTGLIAGSAVRTVLELAGIRNAAAKIYGSNNKINNAYCTVDMLTKFKSRRDLALQHGESLEKPSARAPKAAKSVDKTVVKPTQKKLA